MLLQESFNGVLEIVKDEGCMLWELRVVEVFIEYGPCGLAPKYPNYGLTWSTQISQLEVSPKIGHQPHFIEVA